MLNRRYRSRTTASHNIGVMWSSRSFQTNRLPDRCGFRPKQHKRFFSSWILQSAATSRCGSAFFNKDGELEVTKWLQCWRPLEEKADCLESERKQMRRLLWQQICGQWWPKGDHGLVYNPKPAQILTARQKNASELRRNRIRDGCTRKIIVNDKTNKPRVNVTRKVMWFPCGV